MKAVPGGRVQIVALGLAGTTLRISFVVPDRPAPVLLFSHGQGLTQGDYTPLVELWAQAGFIVMQPAHVTDPALAPRGLWHARIMDIHRLIDGLAGVIAAVPMLAGRVDATRIVVAGHSYGGHTAGAVFGARVRDPGTGLHGDFSHPAVRAAILLAPPGHFDGLVPEWQARAPYLDVDWAGLRGPSLLLAGLEDQGVMSRRGWSWHTDAFCRAAPGGKALITLAGAGHYLGGIDGRAPASERSPAHVALVGAASAGFLWAALDPAAPGWPTCRAGLAQPGLIHTLEFK